LDNSGLWGKGGFFASLSALSPLLEEEYELAGKMDDLELGSVHLIKVGPRENEDPEGAKIYVANIIVQKRGKKQTSGILIPELKRALDVSYI
jgi:hypothetical protein